MPSELRERAPDDVKESTQEPKGSVLKGDLIASLVTFLVALPLCMGIAIASGVPPALGIATGVIGGLIVGAISGSPLQVSGPAAGLAVIVFELVQEKGLPMLGPILILTGFIQFLAGRFKLGQWFQLADLSQAKVNCPLSTEYVR